MRIPHHRDPRWPLHNTAINTPPFPRMTIHGLCFDAPGDSSCRPPTFVGAPASSSSSASLSDDEPPSGVALNLNVVAGGAAVCAAFVVALGVLLGVHARRSHGGGRRGREDSAGASECTALNPGLPCGSPYGASPAVDPLENSPGLW